MSILGETGLQRWSRFEGYLSDLDHIQLGAADEQMLQSLRRVTQHEFVYETHHINQREVVQAMATWSVTARNPVSLTLPTSDFEWQLTTRFYHQGADTKRSREQLERVCVSGFNLAKIQQTDRSVERW